ncbi:MAG TPA: D-alanine--D-alanine ligase [Thermoanaerobaculia bacterium]|jgi:D-alanine-D-alanine ligase|nr:D-alanine--D-alanine ligase [Thermoanaerobaculia bacterium]
MRLGLTYNLKPAGAELAVADNDQFEEFDSVETIEALESAMRAAGHEPVRLGWGLEMLEALQHERVDGVFNIAEGVGGRGRESQVPAVLEMLAIPCTGSDAIAIALTLDKALAKIVAKAAGIATAPWFVTDTSTDKSVCATPILSNQQMLLQPKPNVAQTLLSVPGKGAAPDIDLAFPVFAKPAAEGSSMGITEASLCRNETELDSAIERLSKYGPVLVEEFLPGDEFTVGIVGGEVLGVMQVLPRGNEKDFIYSLDVKRDYLNRVDYRLVDAPDVAEVALQVWRAFGLRDVARIDVRRDRNGAANFVEVNPLPGVHPINSDLVILARLAGISHQELIGRIVAAAIRRWAA